MSLREELSELVKKLVDAEEYEHASLIINLTKYVKDAEAVLKEA